MHDDPGPPSNRWGVCEVDVRVHAISSFQRPGTSRRRFCLLSAEGDVIFIDDPIARERISGAGISSPDSKYYGRMSAMRDVGGTLFACGEGGQVYRRADDGTWPCLDLKLLQGSAVPAADALMLMRVNGSHSEDVYVVGRFGTILHWNGKQLQRLQSPTQVMLTDILVETPDKIWICGRDGTLLCGNARQGFAPAHGSGGAQRFATMALFQEKLYLASGSNPRGLFLYDGSGFTRVRSGLTPDIEDVHTVDAGYGAMWTVGSKDILRFDGKRWERIDFPGNPPVR